MEIETQDLEIGCDSLLVVGAVNDLKPLGAEIDTLVRIIQDLLRNFRRWTMKHKWRESNTCADFLARMGQDDGGAGEVVHYLQSPRDLGLLLLRDVAGLSLSFLPPDFWGVFVSFCVFVFCGLAHRTPTKKRK